MDERKLKALFHEAVQEAPPTSFDEKDVIRGARRVTVRRRMAATGGTLVAATVLAGGVGIGTGMVGPGDERPDKEAGGAVMSAPEPARPQEIPRIKAEQPSPRSSDPEVLRAPSSSSGCGAQDAELAEALASQLPAAGGPVAASVQCPSGARSASFALREGPSTGSVSVILSPAGTASPEQARPGVSQHPDGTNQVTSKARSGKLIILVSEPGTGSPGAPFSGELPRIVEDLAEKF